MMDLDEADDDKMDCDLAISNDMEMELGSIGDEVLTLTKNDCEISSITSQNLIVSNIEQSGSNHNNNIGKISVKQLPKLDNSNYNGPVVRNDKTDVLKNNSNDQVERNDESSIMLMKCCENATKNNNSMNLIEHFREDYYQLNQNNRENPFERDIQINQNSVCYVPTINVARYYTNSKNLNPRPALDQIHLNYMYQSLHHNLPLHRDPQIYTEIVTGIVSNDFKIPSTPMVSHLPPSDKSGLFNYSLGQLDELNKTVNVSSVQNVHDWLRSRLALRDLFNSDKKSADIYLLEFLLFNTFLNVAMDLMIFYHSKSEHMKVILKIESINLLRLCKLSGLQHITDKLHDGFSQELLNLISNDIDTLDIIPDVAEKIINNYDQLPLSSNHDSMKQNRLKRRPRMVYCSFTMPEIIVNKGMMRRFSYLQRRYISRFFINTIKNKEVLIEVLCDYDSTSNSEGMMKQLVNWSYPYNLPLQSVVVALSIPKFFLCDEVHNLIRRQHMLREINPNFLSVLRWVRTSQLDSRYI